MLECVECQYAGTRFNARPYGISRGAFTYVAECPRCGSRMVKHLPGYHISELQMGIAVDAPDVFLERWSTQRINAGLFN